MTHTLKIKTEDKGLLWTRKDNTDTCYDVRCDRDFTVKAGEYEMVSTGVALGIPAGYWVRIEARSGLACKHGVLIGAGVIDNSYVGEVKVMFYNGGKEDLSFSKYDRIAQARISMLEDFVLEEVDSLEETSRGEKGFGSSGVK
ncbi:MAG: dUTP diphosphatase [Bacteroidia bacterium]|nr:dUTP diphosphatase [Bacteroidia bacterium]